MVRVKKTIYSLISAVGTAALAGVGLAAWGNTELRRFELKDVTVPLLPPGPLRGRVPPAPHL